MTIRMCNHLPGMIRILEYYSQFRSDWFKHLCSIKPYSGDRYSERISLRHNGRYDNLKFAISLLNTLSLSFRLLLLFVSFIYLYTYGFIYM